MDQDSSARSGLVGFTIDFESMSIVYEGGFSVPIVAMIDRFDMETDDPEEAEELLVRVPPDGYVVVIVMDDLIAQEPLVQEIKH